MRFRTTLRRRSFILFRQRLSNAMRAGFRTRKVLSVGKKSHLLNFILELG